MERRSGQGIRRLAVFGALGWMAIIFALSSLPGSAVPGNYSGLGHFVLYAVLGALYLLALPPSQPAWHRLALAVLFASAYGVTDEFHQSFVPGRMPDVMDWAVDTAGALVAVLALTAAMRRSSRGTRTDSA